MRPTLCPSLRGLNALRPHRAVFEIHELIHGQAQQWDAGRLLLGLGLAHGRPPA